MNFQESESYLYSLGNEVETMKLGLGNITTLLTALGGPHNKYKKVQVAGTNGKGSVCAFLDSICREADIRTGLYTSPHLVSITERIKTEGVDITEDEFARLATRVRETSESLVRGGRLERVPTFFEQVTAIALLAFAEHRVDLAILETGLGGRYDAVTAANAEIAAITRIDLDHQEYLGDTIQEIAAEKAAIIGTHSKVVALHQSREAEHAISGRCREVGVEPKWATENIVITTVDEDPEYKFHVFTLATESDNYPHIEPHIRGRHQGENMAVAVGVAELLMDEGFQLSNLDICIGLGTADHPGRLENLQPNFLLDGAHNPGGAKVLVNHLNEFYSYRPITLIFGAMRDKAVDEIASILWPKAEKLILTTPSNSRALTADELAANAPKSLTMESIVKTKSIDEAIKRAKAVTSEDGIIVVTGSLYLVGEVRKELLLSRSI